MRVIVLKINIFRLRIKNYEQIKCTKLVHPFSAVYPEEEVQLAPYIGLAVAFAVFTCVAAVMFLLRRRKGRDHRMYDRANSGVFHNKIL